MNLSKVLAELREELSNIEAAIASLERLQRGTRRGRPPAWLKELREHTAARTAPGRRSSEARQGGAS